MGRVSLRYTPMVADTRDKFDRNLSATREALEENLEATKNTLDAKIDATREALETALATKTDDLSDRLAETDARLFEKISEADDRLSNALVDERDLAEKRLETEVRALEEVYTTQNDFGAWTGEFENTIKPEFDLKLRELSEAVTKFRDDEYITDREQLQRDLEHVAGELGREVGGCSSSMCRGNGEGRQVGGKTKSRGRDGVACWGDVCEEEMERIVVFILEDGIGT